MAKFDPVSNMVAYHAALESRDMVFLRAAFTEHAEYRSKGLGPVSGKAAILDSISRYFEKYPDHKAWDTHVESDGPFAARCEWQLQATNPQTGETFSRHGRERVAFNAEGLITTVEVEDLG